MEEGVGDGGGRGGGGREGKEGVARTPLGVNIILFDWN